MALAIVATTVQNITRVVGTTSGGAGGTTTAVIFNNTGATWNVERFRIKVIRLLVFLGTAADSYALKDLGTTSSATLGNVPVNAGGTPNTVWESAIATTTPVAFIDQTNLGDEFRNGLQITATVTTASNGTAFVLYLYHGLS